MSGATEARVALRELASRYALAVDDRSLDTLVGLFAADARFAAANGNFDVSGRDAITAEYRRQLGGLGPSFHIVHDQVVELDPADPDRATGVATGHAEVWRRGKLYLTAMRYRDRYVRTGGEWRFAERMLGFLYYTAADDYSRMTSDLDRFSVPGVTRAADWPELGADWQAFYAG